jgi:hypothetical protein
MGYRSLTLTPATSHIADGIAERLSPGALVAATLVAQSGQVNCVEAYGRIFLAESTPDAVHTVYHIASGYFGYINPLVWNGAIPVGDDHFIEFILHAPVGVVYRLTWWVADKLTAATGFPRDP